MSDHIPRKDVKLPPTIGEAKLMALIEELERGFWNLHREYDKRGDRIEERDDIIRHDRERIEELVCIVNSKDARIEELEAKLAKAVEALEFYRSAINLRIDCKITYAMQEAHDNAETFLAELNCGKRSEKKGETDA
jgi:predicted RNase H-like nuclease (RuvC/YqgF family)